MEAEAHFAGHGGASAVTCIFFLDSEAKICLFLLIKVRVIHVRLPSRLEQERFTMMNRNSTN